MSGTVGDLRSAVDHQTRKQSDGQAGRKIAWAGASWGTFAADADGFTRLLAEAADDQTVVAGLVVVFADGSWLEWDEEGWKGGWKLEMPDQPDRGDQPLSVIADDDGTEIDEANGLYAEGEEAAQ